RPKLQQILFMKLGLHWRWRRNRSVHEMSPVTPTHTFAPHVHSTKDFRFSFTTTAPRLTYRCTFVAALMSFIITLPTLLVCQTTAGLQPFGSYNNTFDQVNVATLGINIS